MIKKIISSILAVTALLTLSACNESTKSDKPVVIATNFALYDFSRAVCGELCDVRMLLSPGSDAHDFETTLEDIALISTADVFVYVGGESEEWVDGILESAGNSDVARVCAIDRVETYTVAEDEHHEHDGHDEHDEGEAFGNEDHEHAEIDEHVWTSIPNAVELIKDIKEIVMSVYPGETSEIISGTERYIAQLNEIDSQIREITASAKRKSLVFADRFPFRYFTEEYGLDYCAAFSGCSSSVEPTLSTVSHIVEEVKAESIPAVLTIEFSDQKTAKAVKAETGCEIYSLHSAHNVTKEDFESGVTYADIMRKNAEVLRIVLN